MERDEEEIVERRPRRRGWDRLRGRMWQGVLALALVGAGVAGGAVWSERRAGPKPPAETSGRGASAEKRMPAMPGMAATQDAAAKAGEPVDVTLTPDAVERAGIKTAVVGRATATTSTTVPATVTSNAYRDTKVNSLVGGIVRQVPVELGSTVGRGQPLAVIFSAELAEAQMKYLSMRALLEADRQKLVRTEKLVALGAASRQELEEITATRASRETELAAARQRLLLLGLSARAVSSLTDASQVVSEVTIASPADGVVIARNVNPGQVVGAAQELFTVTDLRSVWVIGDLYENDFASVRVGSGATVRIPSATSVARHGRVAYIDPRVDPATRTAKVRVEVTNHDTELRFGMYVTLNFETAAGVRVTLIPREAVQSIGDRSVVYVPAEGEEGRFTERPVKLGSTVGDSVEVLDGLKPGERVVTAGSFFLRSEAARNRTAG